MATDNSNQTVGSQSTNNNLTGNGKWQSTDGSSLDSGSGFGGAASGSTTPSQDIGTDVKSLLSSSDLVTSAMSNPGYNNSNYDFSAIV